MYSFLCLLNDSLKPNKSFKIDLMGTLVTIQPLNCYLFPTVRMAILLPEAGNDL